MSDEFAQHALGVIGTALYVARAIPSTARVIRTKRVDQGGVAGLVQLPTALAIVWRAYRSQALIQRVSPSAQHPD